MAYAIEQLATHQLGDPFVLDHANVEDAHARRGELERRLNPSTHALENDLMKMYAVSEEFLYAMSEETYQVGSFARLQELL